MSKVEELATKLVPFSNYELTKIQIKNEDSRHFMPGDKISGEIMIFRKGLLIGGVLTSEVIDYSQNGENFVVETKNSVYTLEKINE